MRYIIKTKRLTPWPCTATQHKIQFSSLSLNQNQNHKDWVSQRLEILKYNKFVMIEYLSSHEEGISNKKEKWLFRCRGEDMEVWGNDRWKYGAISCSHVRIGLVKHNIIFLIPHSQCKRKNILLLYRDGQSAPIWSRLQFDPQSFEAPASALIK